MDSLMKTSQHHPPAFHKGVINQGVLISYFRATVMCGRAISEKNKFAPIHFLPCDSFMWLSLPYILNVSWVITVFKKVLTYLFYWPSPSGYSGQVRNTVHSQYSVFIQVRSWIQYLNMNDKHLVFFQVRSEIQHTLLEYCDDNKFSRYLLFA